MKETTIENSGNGLGLFLAVIVTKSRPVLLLRCLQLDILQVPGVGRYAGNCPA